MGPKRMLVSSASVLAIVAALAACSSSNKSTSQQHQSDVEQSVVHQSGISRSVDGRGPDDGTPIKVGMLCTCSGAGGFGADILPAKDVYQAWVNTVNAAGGIEGHQVQLIVKDDAGNPGTAVTNAQALINQHVTAIADVSILDQAFEQQCRNRASQ